MRRVVNKKTGEVYDFYSRFDKSQYYRTLSKNGGRLKSQEEVEAYIRGMFSGMAIQLTKENKKRNSRYRRKKHKRRKKDLIIAFSSFDKKNKNNK